MGISFGSGQTNGLPLLVTAITSAGRQLLHTFPAGSATPNRVSIFAQNVDAVLPHTLYLAVEDSGATLLRLFTVNVPVNSGLFDVLGAAAGNDQLCELIQNGASTIKVYSDTASVLAVYARVDDQSTTSGIVCQNIAMGLVAAVQNASRFACPAPGAGVGTATEANANIILSRAGTLRNLIAFADQAVGGGATVTVAVRVNGVTSALSVAIAAAQTTVAQIDTDSVAVALGDKVTFLVSCDNAGAPAANFQAAVQFA